MQPAELVRIISGLHADQPLTDALEGRSSTAGYPGPRRPYYASQKEHLVRFIGQYGTPGAYGRTRFDATARDWYQRFQCAPGLLWLAEALGEDGDVLERGIKAIAGAGLNSASQCAAFRRIVPWSRIEQLLRSQPAGRRWWVLNRR